MKTGHMKNIVIVDEDVVQLAPFVAELGLRGLKVRRFFEADACLRSAIRIRQVDAYIIDVMLKSKRHYARSDTQDHLYTGVFLARDVRALHPEVPIILFTNHSFKESISRIKRAVASIGNCAFVPKQSFVSALEFGNAIDAVLADGIGAIKKGFWARFGSGILAQPNFHGIGIDLKKLFSSQ
jgi:CheY-like chemotaxis protein